VEIQVLGAHQYESKGRRLTSFLVDGVLAIDAGSLTSALSLAEQQRIKHLLLTHHHFDHTRDLVTLGANAAFCGWGQVKVYAIQDTLDVVVPCLLDGRMYIDFLSYPSEGAACMAVEPLEPNVRRDIEGYEVLPLPVRHSVSCVGYHVASADGKSLFYTGDTTSGISECWREISPQLILVEVSGLNEHGDWLRKVGHLSARLLGDELEQFRRMKGYLPRVVVVHLGNHSEERIREEVAQMAADLGAEIGVATEGMTLTL